VDCGAGGAGGGVFVGGGGGGVGVCWVGREVLVERFGGRDGCKGKAY